MFYIEKKNLKNEFIAIINLASYCFLIFVRFFDCLSVRIQNPPPTHEKVYGPWIFETFWPKICLKCANLKRKSVTFFQVNNNEKFFCRGLWSPARGRKCKMWLGRRINMAFSFVKIDNVCDTKIIFWKFYGLSKHTF